MELHSHETEEAVLGACMLDGPDIYNQVREIIQPSDMHDVRCRNAFAAMTDLIRDGGLIDPISVAEQMRKQGQLDGYTMQWLMGVANAVLSSASACHHACIIRRYAQLRQLVTAYSDGISMAKAMSDPEDVRAAVDRIIEDEGSRSSGIHSVAASSGELLDDFKRMLSGEGSVRSIPTQIPDLDRHLGCRGIGHGEVVVVAAPTSCGKSALAINIGLKVAMSGTPVGIVSLEMPQKQIVGRMVQTISGVSIRRIRDGIASPIEMSKVASAAEKLAAIPMVTAHSVRSVDDLVVQARMMIKKHGTKLLIIDYLQLIPGGNQVKAHAISDISHRIKQLALEEDISIILLAQVNREGAKRESGLSLYDLKDSGDIENDADVVILMWPTGGDIEKAKSTGPSGPFTSLDYLIAKNREGERGIRGTFRFYANTGRFTN